MGIRIAIDASNIRAGGGITHLSELLRAMKPEDCNIDNVTVWAGQKTADHLPQHPRLTVIHDRMLDGSLAERLLWQYKRLPRLVENHADVLFVPGGTYLGSFKPFVAMCQNLLPFDAEERQRYGMSWMRLRLQMLEHSQACTLARAAGVIFPSEAARTEIEHCVRLVHNSSAVIAHGISESFRRAPVAARPLSSYSFDQPFRWLYVSIVDVYKHQWYLAQAVAALRAENFPVVLDLIGPAYEPAFRRLANTLRRLNSGEEIIRYLGRVSHMDLPRHYQSADGFAFASSCESFGQIILEAMASGLAIACANKSAMPEILGEAGLYFDPEKPDQIKQTLRQLMSDEALREALSNLAYKRAWEFSWDRCARETFSFLAGVAVHGRN